MSDYTPTVEDLWHAYWSHNSYERMIRGDHTPVTRAEFDRGLAGVKAEAWDEGEKAGLRRADYEYGASGFQVVKRNPYLEDQGPAANCHLCVGAMGYEDYDGEWRDCSCQLDTPSGTP